MNVKSYIDASLLISGIGLCYTQQVIAADWSIDTGVTPGITYTDNVCLSEDDKQDQWIGLVTPSVRIAGQGNRLSVDVAAAVEMNSLSDSKIEDLGCANFALDNRQQYAPRLNANATAELVENWFFVSARGRADQNRITPFLPSGDDSLNRLGNTNTTYQYAVSPYIAHSFANTADMQLRYTYDEQRNSADLVGDNRLESVQLDINSGPAFNPVSWGILAQYEETEFFNTPGREVNNNTLESARFELGYQLNSTWQINGYYGYEDNDFISFNETTNDISGDFWDIGLRWTPNSRVTVNAGTGNRFFGDTPRFSIDYRHKRSVLRAKYEKQLTYDRNIRTLDNPLPGTDPFGNPIPVNNGEQFDLAPNSTTLTNAPILDERFQLVYGFTGRRSSFTISGSHSKQTRAEDRRKTNFTYVSASFSRNLSRSFSVYTRLGWSEQDPEDTSPSEFTAQSDQIDAAFGLNRSLGPNTNAVLEYRYTDRNSDSDFNNYVENRITFSIRFDLN